MTTEEKVKAYDEAIERAKSKLHYPDKPCFVDVTEIFPELAEREDERIRKAIKLMYSFLPNKPKYIGDVSVEDMFAWLEKQGEKVSAIEGFETEFERQVSHLIASAINREHEYNEGYVKWTANALLNFAKHELKKQGEQKPTDKVEPKFKVGDKICLKPEYRMPDDDTPIANTVFEIRAIDDKHYRFDRSYIFIEDQDKYELIEQKPAGWSEEDEKMLNKLLAVVALYYGYTGNVLDKQSCTSFLKSLKERIVPQSKQVWSEDDEQYLEDTLNLLEGHRSKNTYGDVVEWLKALRPQNAWKPSDEQIKVCKEVYADLLSAKGFDLGTVNGELNRLEEDLKKLKG